MEWFLHSGTAAARLVRTLVEVMLSWIIANIGDILGLFTLDPTIKALLISGLTVLITAIIGFINDTRQRIEREAEAFVAQMQEDLEEDTNE